MLSFEYRLAPEFPYPAAVEDALRAWDYLMLQGCGARDIVLAGDSAGGNLALVLCNRLKTAGRKLPGALILMSPWTDMTMSGQSYTERAEIDPMLTPEYIEAVRLAYAAGRDYRSSDLSPLFADFTGFPPHPGRRPRDPVFGFRTTLSGDEARKRSLPPAGQRGDVACVSDVSH